MKNYTKYVGLGVLVLALGLVLTGCTQVANNVDNVGVTTKSNITTSGDLTASGDLSVGDDVNITDILQYGGVENDWIEGSCADATTTVFSVINPWGANAYVDQVLVSITNGTTTSTFDIGTSSTAYAAPSEAFMDDVSIATSTSILIKNTSGSLSAVYGFTDPGTNSQDIVLWKTGEYINATFTETDGTGGLTSGNNTFTCTYKIHSFK